MYSSLRFLDLVQSNYRFVQTKYLDFCPIPICLQYFGYSTKFGLRNIKYVGYWIFNVVWPISWWLRLRFIGGSCFNKMRTCHCPHVFSKGGLFVVPETIKIIKLRFYRLKFSWYFLIFKSCRKWCINIFFSFFFRKIW